jgi:hypothetical protein
MTSTVAYQPVDHQVMVSCIYPKTEENIGGRRILTGEWYEETPISMSSDLAKVMDTAKKVFFEVSELGVQSDNFSTRYKNSQHFDIKKFNIVFDKLEEIRAEEREVRPIPGSFEATTRRSMRERVGNCQELAHIALLHAPVSLDRFRVAIIKERGEGGHVFCVFHPKERKDLRVICDVWAGLVCPYEMGLRYTYHYMGCLNLPFFVDDEEIIECYPLIVPFNPRTDFIEWHRIEDLDAGEMVSIPSHLALQKWCVSLCENKILPSNWRGWIERWIENNPYYENPYGIRSADLKECLSSEDPSKCIFTSLDLQICFFTHP